METIYDLCIICRKGVFSDNYIYEYKEGIAHWHCIMNNLNNTATKGEKMKTEKEQIRVLLFSNPNGDDEYVYFTDDLATDKSEFTPCGCACDDEKIIPNNLPVGFPFNYLLKRD